MQRLVLTINNTENTQIFLNFIEQFNFIENIEISVPVSKFKITTESKSSKNLKEISKNKFKSWEEFENHCGIWEGRDITKDSLRKAGWRKY
jgi:hypothetical protein